MLLLLKKTIGLLVFLGLIVGISAKSYSHTQGSSVSYAEEWCNSTETSKNPPPAKGYNVWNNDEHESDNWYSSYTSDCANFVSQCLIAGDSNYRTLFRKFLDLDNTNNHDGPEFTPGNPNDNKGNGGTPTTIINVDGLNRFLRDYRHSLFILGTWSDVIVPGDVFLIPTHATFVDYIDNAYSDNEKSTYNAHTNDVYRGHTARIYWTKTYQPPAFDLSKSFYHLVPTVPYVKKIIVTEAGGKIIYSAHWSDDSPRVLIQDVSSFTAGSADLKIVITFNESIKTNPGPSIQIGVRSVNSGNFNNIQTEWTCTFPASQLKGLDGVQTVAIIAYNYATDCNSLDSNPATVGTWNETTSKFDGYEDETGVDSHMGGKDNNHHITFVSSSNHDIMAHKTNSQAIDLGLDKGFVPTEVASFSFPLYQQPGPLYDLISYIPSIKMIPLQPYLGAGPYSVKASVEDFDDPTTIIDAHGNTVANPTNIRKLYYTTDNGQTWNSRDMVLTDRTDIYNDEFDYVAEIPDLNYPDGTVVKYYVEAKDKDDNRATYPETQLTTGPPETLLQFTVDKNPPTFIISASPNPFSPNGDGVNDRTVISYQVNDTSDFVNQLSMRLLDPSGNVVTSWPTVAFFPSPGWDSMVWDGQALPEGRYRLQISAIDRAFNTGSAESPIVVDKTPPVIYNPAISISPGNYPGVFTSQDTQITLAYQCQENYCNTVDVQIQFNSGTTVINRDQQLTVVPGTKQAFTLTWDGKDDSGQYVTDGVYCGSLVATDSAGNVCQEVSIPSFEVHRTAAKVVSMQVDNALFTPDDGPSNQGDGNQDTVTLTYGLSKPSQVTVQIKDVLGRVLLQIEPTGAVQNGSYTWAGKINGVFAADGIYTFQVNTLDEYGNSSFRTISTIKNKVPAKIVFPKNNDVVGNTVVVTGIAVDPGITDPSDFDCYKLWVRQGGNLDFSDPDNNPISLSADWYPICVPVFNQNFQDAQYPHSNSSIRTVMNGVLGDWDTSTLTPGQYTLLLVTADKGGHVSYDSCTVTVNPAADVTTPTIALTSPASTIPAYQYTITSPQDILNIAYDLTQATGKQTDLSLDIVKMLPNDIWGPVVYHFDSPAQIIGGNLAWNGKTISESNIVTNGEYKLLITARDTDHMGENISAVYVNLSCTASSPLGIDLLEADPEITSLGNSINVSYRISKPAKVSIVVQDATGNTVQALVTDANNVDGITYQIPWTAAAEGLYMCRLQATALNDNSQAQAAVPISIISTTGSGTARIDTPTENQILQGKTLLTWSAGAQGEYYPPQDFICAVSVNGKESYYPSQPTGYYWNISASADETYPFTKTGTQNGAYAGEDTTHAKQYRFGNYGGHNVVNLGAQWSEVNVFYGSDIDFPAGVIPNPVVSVRNSYNGYMEITERRRDGFKARSFVITDIHATDMTNWVWSGLFGAWIPVDENSSQAHLDDWYYGETPDKVAFDWSVLGQRTGPVVSNTSGSGSVQPGTPSVQDFSVAIQPQHAGGTLSRLQLIMPALGSGTYFPGSNDFDNNPNISTSVSDTYFSGNVCYGKLHAVNTTALQEKPWSTLLNLNSSTASQWSSPYKICYYNHPLISNSFRNFFTTPSSVYNIVYTAGVPSNTNISVKIGGDSLTAVSNSLDSSWTSALDQGLVSTQGKILQSNVEFNENPDYSWFITANSPTAFSTAYPNVDGNAAADIKNKFTFWKFNGTAMDNPYIGVKNWNVGLFYPDGSDAGNTGLGDFSVDPILWRDLDPDTLGNPKDLNDQFRIHLAKNTAPQRYIAINGETSSLGQGFKSYALFYQKDGTSNWSALGGISNTPVASGGILGNWNITELQGVYHLRLLVWDGSGISEVIRTVTIGKLINAAEGSVVNAPCNKAYLKIPADSLATDTVINISPQKPNRLGLDPSWPQPVGPVYKLEPEGLVFSVTKTAMFTVRLLPEELFGVNPELLNIYYLKNDGTLESLDIPVLEKEISDDGVGMTKLSSPITHFSSYVVLASPAAPTLYPPISPTNVTPVNVSGTAEPKSSVELFVNGASVGKTQTDTQGAFALAVPLTEGDNQITAKATRVFANGNLTSKLSSPVTVVLDTIPPAITDIFINPNPFSPNGDGINDYVNVGFSISEPTTVSLKVWDWQGNLVRQIAQNDSLTTGAHTYIWDGKNTQGSYVPQGAYWVEIIADDLARNESRYKERVVVLTDAEAPKTVLLIGQPSYQDGSGNTILASTTTLTLQVSDSGSGVSKLRYRINGGFWQDQYVNTYSFSMPFADGIYQLDYLSFDKQGNPEKLHGQQLSIDHTGPNSSVKAIGPSFNAGGNLCVSSNTVLEVSAVDPVVNQVSSGVQAMYYQIDNQAFNKGSNIMLGQLPNGLHTIGCYAVDNVGNSGAVNMTSLILDNTPPVSNLNHSEAYFTWNGGLYVSPTCLFTLTAVDTYSGVSATVLQIDGNSWQYNPTPFALPKGDHILNYYAIDNVGNGELAQSIAIHVPLPDTTPPVTTLTIGNPKFPIPNTQLVETLVTTYTAFSLSAVDILGPNDGVALGVAYTQYAINTTGVSPTASDWQTYSTPIYLPNSGMQYFWYRSVDLGGNTETVKYAPVLVKTTKPGATLNIPSSDNTGVCRVINGTVNIYGTAQDQYFANYTLTLVSSSSTRQLTSVTYTVQNGILGVLNTKAFESGEYQLILDAKDLLGQESVSQVTVVLHEPALKQLVTYVQEKDRDDECKGEPIRPQYLAQDKDGNIYVTDSRKYAYKLDPSGTQVLGRYPKDNKHEHEKDRLIHPQGIAVDSQGFVYVVDQARNCVNKYTNAGELVKGWQHKGVHGHASLRSPQGMCLGTDGLLYIADQLNGSVAVFDKDLNFVKEIRFTGQVTAACHNPSGKLQPTDVAVFRNVLYVTDKHASKVYKFRLTDDACVGIIGKEGDKRKEFKQPQGISTNSLGYWYVSDTGNGRIIKYNAKDEVVAVWAVREIQHGRYLNGSTLGVCALTNGEVLAADVKLGDVKRYGLGDTLVPPPGAITTNIVSPASGSLVNGYVHIFGTAKTADYKYFSGFELSYLPAGGQEKIIAKGNSVKEQELLAVWDTTHLACGNYELKLTVKNKAGQQKSAISSIALGDWSYLGQIGTGGQGSGNNQFNTPWDADIDHYGQLYVADSGNDRVQKFN
jgi:gliding motility-associated-like protein